MDRNNLKQFPDKQVHLVIVSEQNTAIISAGNECNSFVQNLVLPDTHVASASASIKPIEIYSGVLQVKSEETIITPTDEIKEEQTSSGNYDDNLQYNDSDIEMEDPLKLDVETECITNYTNEIAYVENETIYIEDIKKEEDDDDVIFVLPEQNATTSISTNVDDLKVEETVVNFIPKSINPSEIYEHIYVAEDDSSHLSSDNPEGLVHIATNYKSIISSELGPIRSWKSLPRSILNIRASEKYKNGVFTIRNIPKNVRLGPIEGVTSLNQEELQVWRIKDGKLYYSFNRGHWSRYVNYSENPKSQNLTLFQHGGCLYFKTLRTIGVDEELLIKYPDLERIEIYGEDYWKPPKETNFPEAFTCSECNLGYISAKYLKNHLCQPSPNQESKIVICWRCKMIACEEKYMKYHKLHCKPTFKPGTRPTTIQTQQPKTSTEQARDNKPDTTPTTIQTQKPKESPDQVKDQKPTVDTIEKDKEHASKAKRAKINPLPEPVPTIEIFEDHKDSKNETTEICESPITLNTMENVLIDCLLDELEKLVPQDEVTRKIKCPRCPFATQFKDVVKDHFLKHLYITRDTETKGKKILGNCLFCDKETTNLHEHMKEKHITSELLHTLGKCQFKSIDIMHKEKESENKWEAINETCGLEINTSYKCKYCSKTFKNLSRMERHVGKHSAELSFGCKWCHYMGKLNRDLQKHMKTEHPTKSKKDDQLVRHKDIKVNSISGRNENKLENKICKICGKHCLKLRVHIKKRHMANYLYKCDHCQMKFYKLFELFEHMIERHPDKSIEKDKICSICEQFQKETKCDKHKCFKYSYTDIPMLISYIKDNHKGKISDVIRPFPGKCKFCDSTHDDIEKHMQKDHNIRRNPLECASCEFICISKNDMIEHQKSHRLTRPEDEDKVHEKTFHAVRKCRVCSLCRENFNILLDHVETRHKNEDKKYTCTCCSFSCCSSKTFIKHMHIRHSRNKKHKAYLCPFCVYPSKSKQQLMQHLKWKHNIKIYYRHINRYGKLEIAAMSRKLVKYTKQMRKCLICGVLCKFLHCHVKKHHGKGKILRCNRCIFKCIDVNELFSHIRAAHIEFKSYDIDDGIKEIDLYERIYMDSDNPEGLVHIATNYKSIIGSGQDWDIRSSKSLPRSILNIRASEKYKNGVFAIRHIPKNIRLGPIEGVASLNPGGLRVWRIKDGKLYYAFTRGLWPRHVNYSDNPKSQNLTLFQHDGCLYFKTLRTIGVDEELLIKYLDLERIEIYGEDYCKVPEETNCPEAFTCSECNLGYISAKHRKNHHCQPSPNQESKIVACWICKIACEEKYMKYHKLHCKPTFKPKKSTKRVKQQTPPPTVDTIEKDKKEHTSKAKRAKKTRRYPAGTNVKKSVANLSNLSTVKINYIDSDNETPVASVEVPIIENQIVDGYVYKCSLCSYKSIGKKQYSQHFKTHFSGNEFWCLICSKKFSRKRTLSTHTKKFHGKTKLR